MTPSTYSISDICTSTSRTHNITLFIWSSYVKLLIFLRLSVVSFRRSILSSWRVSEVRDYLVVLQSFRLCYLQQCRCLTYFCDCHPPEHITNTHLQHPCSKLAIHKINGSRTLKKAKWKLIHPLIKDSRTLIKYKYKKIIIIIVMSLTPFCIKWIHWRSNI